MTAPENRPADAPPFRVLGDPPEDLAVRMERHLLRRQRDDVDLDIAAMRAVEGRRDQRREG